MPLEIERKFLVKAFPPLDEFPVSFKALGIEQRFLPSPEGTVERIRSVLDLTDEETNTVFFHTVKKHIEGGVNEEDEREITWKEYTQLYGETAFQPIIKQRIVFDWQGHTFELDIFTNPPGMKPMLEVELESLDEDVQMPPFVIVEREVTGEKDYSNYRIAQGVVVP